MLLKRFASHAYQKSLAMVASELLAWVRLNVLYFYAGLRRMHGFPQRGTLLLFLPYQPCWY